ncbi:hypothetical protein C3K47_19055 [Solitalea longa]|uniref:Uncharacterized protein n=1 Tax=Solitalea longa TaxID=2079460 RepID=A0A2S4ZWE1_9SPHI|nr:ankyrin repeat domain-containing protein [Solitalea longa]POY34681.1 hypothetical protein C3K47_19055 [Solitalea longa]
MAISGRPKKCDPQIDNIRSKINSDDFITVKATLKEFGINAEDSYGRTALINAVLERKTAFIEWLMDNGANLNHQDRTGYSSLHFTGQEKLPDLAKLLLSKGADPNIADLHGNPPLWTAIFNAKGDFEVVKHLLRSGANPDLVNKHSKTPRFMFLTLNNEDIETLDLK